MARLVLTFCMIVTRLLFLLTALLAGLAVTKPVAARQDVSVLASVDETTVGEDETVTYTLEIKGASSSEVETPEPPATEGLVLLQSIPSTQRNVSLINGRMQQSLAFQWHYRPVRQGSARFDPVAVTVQGESYRTSLIRLTVVPQSQRPQRPSSGNPATSLFRRAPSPTPPASGADGEPDIAPKDLFIRAIPSATEAYFNEQVDVEYRLYFRNGIQMRQSRLADSWDAEGFWREDLDVENRPVPRTVVEDGLRYNTITLKRVAVFPTRAGELTIDPLRIDAEALASGRSRDPFDRFFSTRSQYQSIELASDPVTIEARPLPEGAPSSFRDAVGAFRMTTDVSRTRVEVGEPVEIEVQLSGTGNLATLEAPSLDVPDAFELYDPQLDLNINRSLQRVRGTKTFTYVLVPLENGTFELPEIVFSYFDPETEVYETLSSDPVRVEVTGTTNPELARRASSNLRRGEIAGLMMTAGSWTPTRGPLLYRRAWTYLVLLLPLLWLGGLMVYRRWLNRLESDVRYARNRRAHPMARAHLRRAESLRQEDRPRPFYEALELAVLGFVSDRLNVAPSGMTRLQLNERLALSGIEEEDRRDLLTFLEACDQARFSPSRPTPEAMERSYSDAAALIVRYDTLFSHKPAGFLNRYQPTYDV